MTDSAVADHAVSNRTTRRNLLGAGVVGAMLAAAGARPASAGSERFTEDELALLGFAISFELTARDLYDASIAAGAGGEVWTLMREQHESYAQRLAGITGISANQRIDAIYDSLVGDFETGDPVDAAYDLESTAGATHTELLGQIGEVDAAEALASFIAMEARHSTVLAGLGGRADDFDAMFLNTATPVDPEASS